MKRIVAGLALALLLASPVTAAPQPYSIALDGVTDSVAAFTVTRTGNFDNDPVAWVHISCPGTDEEGNIGPDELPVIWGLDTSTIGTVSLLVDGSACTAWATTTPWRVRHNDPSIVF